MSAVTRIDPDSVYLNVTMDDIKNRGYDNPPFESRETFGEHVSDTLDPDDEPRL